MQWYAVYVKATGELVSTGTVVADPLHDHLAVVPLAEQPNWSIHDWSPERLALTMKVPE